VTDLAQIVNTVAPISTPLDTDQRGADCADLARLTATDCQLPDEFWSERPTLAHVRQAALARQRSPVAVLHVVLARAAAVCAHTIELPAIVGARAALCYFIALLAPPGVGKSSTNSVGAEIVLVPAGLDIADQLPIGSGEGLVEVLFGLVDEDDGTGKSRKVKRQVRNNAYVFVDEGTAVDDLGARSGSTLLSTLRSIWSGTTIGNANASEERRRIVPGGQYTYGLVVALQDLNAAALLGDTASGTPQRFAWARAIDPTLPDTPPEWPGALKWTPPDPQNLPTTKNAAGFLRHQIPVDPTIIDELRAGDLARARGETVVDELDAHAGLLQLKIAALLGILDRRLEVTPDDWRLAGQVKAASDTVRSTVVALNAAEAARRETATSQRLANRAVDQDRAVERRRIVECARRIARTVQTDPDQTVAEVRRALRRWRDVFTEGLDHAIDEHWVTEHAEAGQGQHRRVLHPGESTP
jgi:hypothetical protein